MRGPLFFLLISTLDLLVIDINGKTLGVYGNNRAEELCEWVKIIIFALYLHKYTMRRNTFIVALFFALTSFATPATAQTIDKRERIDDINTMLERRRWGEARMALERFSDELNPIVDHNDVAWAEFHKVRCAMELGDSEVEAAMENYLKRYPASTYRNTMQFMLACYVSDNGDYKQASELFKKVDYKGLGASDKERYDMRVGYIRFLEGDYRKAKMHFVKVSKLSDLYPHALYYYSYIVYREGHFIEAEDGFLRLKEYVGYESLAPFYLLQIEYRKGNYDYVINEGEALLKRASSSTRADIVRVLAESYFIQGDYKNALLQINTYPEELFGRQESYIRGYSLYRMTQYREAVAALTKVCGAEDALTQNASYHLADCYLNLGDKQMAADAFALAAVEGFDETIAEDAHLNYCRLKFELGGGVFNESINILKSYMKRYPDSPHIMEIKQLLIAAFFNSENYQAAYVAIREFDNPDREMAAAHQKVAVYLAVDAIERGDWELAESLLSEAEKIALVPKYNALIKYWQGEIAYHKGDNKLAAMYYEEYVRRAPKSEIEYQYAHYGLGYAYLNMGKLDLAQQALQEFVYDYPVRDGFLFDAHNRLGDVYFETRQFENARRVYRVSAASYTDDRFYANYQLAMVDGIDDRQKSKITRLKSIVANGEGPYVDDAWYELGRTYLSLHQYRDGAVTLQSFVEADTTSPFYVSALSDLALAYYNLERKDEARQYYEKVVAYDPQSSAAMSAIRSIRDIYIADGNVDAYFEFAERSGVQSDMSIAARDSLSFAAARTLYLGGDIENAKNRLNNYIETFDKGYNRTEALFYLSDCYVLLDNKPQAMKNMELLLDLGQTQYRERVLDVYARMTFDEQEYEKAAGAYYELYNSAHDLKKRQIASEGYISASLCYLTGGKLQEAAENVIKMQDATEWAMRKALLAKANILRENNSMPEALGLYKKLAENTMTAEGAEAYYYLVENDFNCGDYTTAEERVYALDRCGSEYWHARIFIVLGDVLVKTNNLFQARATYQSVVDGYSIPDDGVITEAKKRIASIGK